MREDVRLDHKRVTNLLVRVREQATGILSAEDELDDILRAALSTQDREAVAWVMMEASPGDRTTDGVPVYDPIGVTLSEEEAEEWAARGNRFVKPFRLSTQEQGVEDEAAGFICEFCYKPARSPLPYEWELAWQSAVCPDCQEKVRRDGGYHIVLGGAYSFAKDPRARRPTDPPRDLDDAKAAYFNLRTCICGEDASEHPCPDDPDPRLTSVLGSGFDPDWDAVRERLEARQMHRSDPPRDEPLPDNTKLCTCGWPRWMHDGDRVAHDFAPRDEPTEKPAQD